MTTTTTTGRLLASIKTIEPDGDNESPFGSFESVLSTPSVDRDGEIIDARAFEPLPDHIMIDVDHAMSVEKTVASGTPYYDDDGVLMFRGTFASTALAQDVRRLVNEGHIRSLSVAFMNGEYEVDDSDGVVHLRSAELLNAGIVGIPSNREALIRSSKTYTDVVDPDDDQQLSTETPDDAAAEKAAARPAVEVRTAEARAELVHIWASLTD